MPIEQHPPAHSEVSRDDIALVEARIEELAAAIERCRKISLAAKIAAAAGAALSLLTLVGVIAFEPSFLIGGLAAAIGGVVLLGSNATTWDQAEAAMHASETLRADMINKLELRMVGDPTQRLH
jgi:hypothetical protein